MKKLMIMAAVIGATIVANAEQAYTYHFTAYNLDSEKYDGYKIVELRRYMGGKSNLDSTVINAADLTLLSDQFWSAFGVDSWSEYYSALGDNFSTQGEVKNGIGVSTDDSNGVGNTIYSVVFGLFKNGVTPGSEFDILSTVYYEGEKTIDPSFDMTSATVIKSGTLMKDAVPEPTSGLLMLLGMAGLALKRRRA